MKTCIPDISVVMSVHNGAKTLSKSVESVLAQEGVKLEFIVVNDGSSDDSGQILDEYAKREPRLRVLHQKNAGLTLSLIRGCGEARGKYIARQDAGGDTSLPGRLFAQKALLDENSDVVLTSCGTRFVGPGDESLYVIRQVGDELHRGLTRLTLEGIQGPSHHGSTMFRNTTYRSVGGYRSCFRVAQDLDLWLRFAEAGQCKALPDVYYEAALNADSISARSRGDQIRTAELILECAVRRRSSGDESDVLEAAAGAKRRVSWRRPLRLRTSNFFYFLASILREANPGAARSYYSKSIALWPFNPKAMLGWLRLRKTS